MRIYRASFHFANQTGFYIKQYRANCPNYTHTHDFIELVYIVRGQGVHTVDGREYSMGRGSFFVVRPGQTHGLIFDGQVEYYNIFLTESYLREFAVPIDGATNAWELLCGGWKSPVTWFDDAGAETMEWLIKRMNSEFIAHKPHSEALVETLFLAMLLEIQRVREEIMSGTGSHQPHVALPKILDYINAHFTEPIRLKELSEKYNYNPAYFGRLFRRRYGVSFDEYLRKKRIECACELLKNTDDSVETVMHAVGYTNKNNFYRFFILECGCTPGEYRNAEAINDDKLALN